MSDLHLSFRGSKGLPPLAQGADAVVCTKNLKSDYSGDEVRLGWCLIE